MNNNRKLSIKTLIGLSLLLGLAACTQEIAPLELEEIQVEVAENTAGPEEPTEAPEQPTAELEPTEEEAMEEPTEAPIATEKADAEEKVGEEMEENTDDSGIMTTDDRSEQLKSLTSRWNTNWELRTVEYDSFLSGGPPRDGIPSIDDPVFISPAEASDWLEGQEPVIAVEVNGDARAYPLQILTWHEIVNDTVGGRPIIVTFCPLCNAAIAFDRTLNGEPTEFGVSGLLRNSDMVMYDRQTESLWQQFTGDAIVGDAVGTRLEFLSTWLISFDDFQTQFPDGTVLSRETGHDRNYGRNPYSGYDTLGNNPFLFRGEIDGRLPAVERVVAISAEDIGVDVAYPFSIISEVGAVNDKQGDLDIAVFHIGGATSALGNSVIARGEDVGSAAVFNPVVDGQKLTFSRADDKTFVDAETGSIWNIFGDAIDGPLAGSTLEPIVHGNHFWFSWAAFKPDTIIFGG
ncbi:MAG: DUF3179 domain-containing protein [Anaerolineae bacterium]